MSFNKNKVSTDAGKTHVMVLREQLKRERELRRKAELSLRKREQRVDQLSRQLQHQTKQKKVYQKNRRQKSVYEQAIISFTENFSRDCDYMMSELTRLAATTCNVERASIWLLSHNNRNLRCLKLYEKSLDRTSQGTVLCASDYPSYFKALASGRAINAHNARTDPRTREFRDNYLVPLGITSMMDAAIRYEGKVVGVVCHEQVGRARRWTHDEVLFAANLADQASLIMATMNQVKLEKRQLDLNTKLNKTRKTADYDELTSLLNRRAVMKIFRKEIARCLRYGRPLSVALLDLDHFKMVNDRYGHLVGDQTLRALAMFTKSSLREQDVLARYGGEELLLLLPETRTQQAKNMLRRLCASIDANYFSVICKKKRIKLHITASIGIASFPHHGESIEGLIEAADRALYKAKNQGRNCVVTTMNAPRNNARAKKRRL